MFINKLSKLLILPNYCTINTMSKAKIITHRGLEPSNASFFSESSFEAFQDHLNRGYGIEFDPNFTKDNQIIVSHDSDLKRVTSGKNESNFSDITAKEALDIRFEKGGRLCLLGELMSMICKSSETISAMHLKGKFQSKRHLDILIEALRPFKKCFNQFIIFDIIPDTARYLKNALPELILAPSVAHPFDIERYNKCVSNTLFSLENAIANRDIFDWVWLDEWDLSDKNGCNKKFYTEETFNILRKNRFKIALVTPELHGTSPGLLGGEAHSDANNKGRLFTRIQEILSLDPDAICTDYPEEIKNTAN